ncbi:hypothetical protein EC968_008795, partial [Mortierella alpina]
MDLTLEQRVDYMRYWCDPEKREEGFKKADAILLELFERFDLEEEMNIDFTERNEHCWRDFCHSKRKRKDRIAWNKYEWRFFIRTCNNIDLCSGLNMTEIGQTGNIDRLTDDGKYRLGACIYIPCGLNFGKQLLEDFKTLRLFHGTDLENCRKGIKMLRDLMVETAEKMKNRLPKLLGEHAALIADCKENHIKETQVLEEVGDNNGDQYGTASEVGDLAGYDSQCLIMNDDNTNYSAAKDTIQGDNIKLKQHIQHRSTKALSDVVPANRPSHASAVVSRTGQPRVSLLKQLTLDDFLFKQSEGSQPSPPSRHSTVFSHNSPKMKTAKRARQEPAEDSISEAATLDDENAFVPSRALVFGVSGCGKTRAVIELLSQHWGFYFNASSDDWGSSLEAL